VINPGFLRDQRDTGRLEAGLDMIRQAAASPALARVHAAEIAPGPGICAGAAVRDWIRGTVTSYYHPAGTCRIGAGTDPGAVVDTELQVHGVTGLRVADASVLPLIPNAPLNATVLAVAERAADLIGSR
jgi:choline dehydrogenase-like flavoprotein